MSNYHILDGEDEARTYVVVFHIPVPDEVNTAGINIRTSLVADIKVNKISIVPHITGAEQTLLTNGELFEHITSYSRKSGNTQTQDRDALDIQFTTRSVTIANRLRDEYKYWGFDRDVP